MTRPSRLLVLASVLAAACGGGGGGSPTSPSQAPPTGLPAGATLTFVSGETGAPVSGAAVTIGAASYQTDGAGTLRLAAATAFRSVVEARHPAYLDRETYLRTADEVRFTLWPRQGSHGLDEAFTSRLVYTSTDVGDGEPGGDDPLYRLAPGQPMALRPTTEIRGDAALFGLLEDGAGIVNDVVGQNLFYVDAAGTASGPGFTVELKPEDPYCDADTYAFVDYSGRGLVISGGRVIYCEALWYFHQRPASRDLRDYFLATLVHELGHAYGLNHSTSNRDLMYSGGHWEKYARDHGFYSGREELAMRLMWQRRAGTKFPDDDRSGIGTLSGFRRIVRN